MNERLALNKYLVSLIGITAILFSLNVHAYYDEEDSYGYRDRYYDDMRVKWVCDPYTNVCRQIYYRPNARHGWHKTARKAVKEPKFVYQAPPDKIADSNIINVNLSHGTWAAYDAQGQLVNSGPVSGGKSYCPDIDKKCKTATGTFKIYEKRGAKCKSKIFPVGKGGAPMPYCMFFHQGFALHGSNAVPNYNASHGCIRMKPTDAKWLHENFVNVGKTRVKVTYDKTASEDTDKKKLSQNEARAK